MAQASELNSLEEIEYGSKVKFFMLVIMVPFLFIIGFLNFFPIGPKIKAQIKSHLGAQGCSPEFQEINMEWFLPKIIVTDLVLPAACMGREGPPMKLNFVKINWQIINFSPLGLPFRIDTELEGQPLSLYYVLGLNQQMVRLKDQKLNLSRLNTLIGENFKLGGTVMVDLNVLFSSKVIKNLALKAASSDMQIPAQNIQGFTLPGFKLNQFYLEANSTNHPRISLNKFIVGDPDSPVRANLIKEGTIDFQESNVPLSPINFEVEVAFSENFKQMLPLIEMMFQSFPQNDGFYQVRLGGSLGAPKLLAR